MKYNRNIEHVFSTPLFGTTFDNLEIFNKCADAVLNLLPEERRQGLAKTGSTSTNDNLHTLDEFKDLVALINKEVEFLFEEHLGLDKKNTHMTCMWSNIQSRRSRHTMHSHPNSFYSGVIYLAVPPGKENIAGDIVFLDPRPGNLTIGVDYKKPNSLSNHTISINPQTGMLILFPGWLQHCTDICMLEEGEYRISLSFNYMLDKCNRETQKLN
jgi:uncharacterized protein (TIGR02466 family)